MPLSDRFFPGKNLPEVSRNTTNSLFNDPSLLGGKCRPYSYKRRKTLRGSGHFYFVFAGPEADFAAGCYVCVAVFGSFQFNHAFICCHPCLCKKWRSSAIESNELHVCKGVRNEIFSRCMWSQLRGAGIRYDQRYGIK